MLTWEALRQLAESSSRYCACWNKLIMKFETIPKIYYNGWYKSIQIQVKSFATTKYVYNVSANLFHIFADISLSSNVTEMLSILSNHYSSSSKLYLRQAMPKCKGNAKKDNLLTKQNTTLVIAVRGHQRSPWAHRAGGLYINVYHVYVRRSQFPTIRSW